MRVDDGPPRAPNPAAVAHPASNVATALAHERDPAAPAARKARDEASRRKSVAQSMAVRLAQLRRVSEQACWARPIAATSKERQAPGGDAGGGGAAVAARHTNCATRELTQSHESGAGNVQAAAAHPLVQQDEGVAAKAVRFNAEL